MPATSTTMAGSYKQVYGKQLIDALGNLSTDLWDKIEVSSDKPRGQGFYFPVHVGANLAGGPTGELSPLREAMSETIVQAVITPVEYEWTIEISNKARRLGEGDKASWVSVVDHAFRSKLDTARNMLGNDVYRDGTGTLSLVNGAVSASTTVVVDDATPFRENMVLDGYESTTNVFQNVQIATVDPFTNTLTLKSAVSIADNGILRINGVTTTQSIHGLHRIIDTNVVSTSYLGISRNTYLKWRGNVVDNGGNSLSGDLLQQCLDRVLIICGKMPPTMISNPSQRRKYLQLSTPLRRFMNGKFDLGYDTLEFNGRGWMIDTKCPRDEINMVDLSDIKRYELNALDLNSDGGTLKPVSGYRKVQAFYEYGGQVAAQNPYWHLRLQNLATPDI